MKTLNGQGINGTQRTMQDTFPNVTKTNVYNITHILTLYTPSAPQFTSYDTNSHETRTTYMTSQHHK